MMTASERSNSSDSYAVPSAATTSPAKAKKWCKCAVASVSPVDITHLTCDELADLIATAGDLLPQFISSEELRTCNREVLERLAFLARECCRNRGY
jgi:hypothetical protein